MKSLIFFCVLTTFVFLKISSMNHTPVEGFSKLSKQGKIEWLVNEYLNGSETALQTLTQYWNPDTELQLSLIHI